MDVVVERAVCLKAVVTFAQGWPDAARLAQLPPEALEKANLKSDRFWDLVRVSGAYGSLTPKERAFAERRWPNISEWDVVQFSWRIEAYKVLLWALRIVDELGPFHLLADPKLVTLKAAEIRASARMRAEVQIARAREEAELWHWRSRTRELFADDHALVEGTARAAHERGYLVELVAGDFAVAGAPYRELSVSDWATVRSLTQERHHALNWLCDPGPWDDVRTDT
jgi:Domain of unknown function (DUF4272)